MLIKYSEDGCIDQYRGRVHGGIVIHTRGKVHKYVTWINNWIAETISHVWENQWEILLAYKRKVFMHAKHIDICHHFFKYMVKDKYIDITCIRSE